MIYRPVMIKNAIQDYAWGSRRAIQDLLDAEPDEETPWAELWMGAHPKAPSQIFEDGAWVPLNKWIEKQPRQALGIEAAERFDNTLPYLFKVLAAEQPLSIQAHPDEAQAREGFARENKEGIPIDAPHRNYRDPWPKPELICALEPFDAMIGFRQPRDMRNLLRQFCSGTLSPQINALAANPDSGGIKTVFHALMRHSPSRKSAILDEALANAETIETEESFWIKRLHEAYPNDIGVLSPLLLNLMRLEPGKALYLPPGILHAYLSGVGIELMANSDNVLRGGLTGKHIDVPELMRVLSFKPFPADAIAPRPIGACEKQYMLDVDHFALSIIHVDSDNAYTAGSTHSAEILLCTGGEADIIETRRGSALKVVKGQTAFIPAAAGSYEIVGAAEFYKAGVPL